MRSDDNDTSESVQCVQPQCHEFDANVLFNEHGLKPFFGTDSRIKAGGGSQDSSFEKYGEKWNVTLYYQDSGIEHPGEETPDGTPFDLDEMREFRVKVQAADDDAGQRSFNAHLSPRWPDMQSVNGNDISPPKGFGDGVNVRISGSNIHFGRYLDLTQSAFESVGVNEWYFYNPEDSTLIDAERYVRIHENRSGPIHGRAGPIAGLSHLLENDRQGFRKLVQNDDDEHGRNLPGYYHTVTLGPRRISETFPAHELPKEIKHYYAREALSLPKSNPLRHPKLGVSYQKSKWDGKVGLDDLDELIYELDQTIHSILYDSELALQDGDGSGPFTSDDYFQADDVQYPDDHIISLDLTEIRQEQDSIVIRHLADGGFSPVEWESLQALVTDGGTLSSGDIADVTGRHVDSVRRALDRLGDMVEKEYGRVSLRSNHIADLVHDAVKEAKESTRRAVEAGAKAIQASRRGIDEATSALVAWASNWDVDLSAGEYVEIDFGEMDIDDLSEARREIRQILREGLDRWQAAGKDTSRYMGGSFTAAVTYDKYPDRTYLNRTKTATLSGPIGLRIDE